MSQYGLADQIKEQFLIQEIINELSECREDERASRNHIFAILAAVATFLTVVMAVISNMTEDKISNITMVNLNSLKSIINGLSTFVICAAIGYIVNLGIISTFRHFYLIELENILHEKLDEYKLDFFHWESVSTPIITLNICHVRGWASIMYCINAYLAFFSILMLAIVYIIFMHELAFNKGPEGLFFSICFYVTLLSACLSIVFSSFKSKKIYKNAKVKARERFYREEIESMEELMDTGMKKKVNSKKYVIKVVTYLIYPRIMDIQKNFFLLIGYSVGWIVMIVYYSANYEFKIHFIPDMKQIVFLWFISDFLIYQARYLWNDLKGIDNDRIHPMKDNRGRIPFGIVSDRMMIILILLTIVFRLVLSAVLIYKCSGNIKEILFIYMAVVIIVTILYEILKTKNSRKWIFFVVSLGYPLRLLVGFFGKAYQIIDVMRYNNQLIIVLVFLSVSTAFFGAVFVSLTWVMEGHYLKRKSQNIVKGNIIVLLSKFTEAQCNSQYPLRCKDELKNSWNMWHIISSGCITISCIVLSYYNFVTMFVSILMSCCLLVLSIKIGREEKQREAFDYVVMLIPVILEGIVFIFFTDADGKEWLFMALLLIQCGYSFVYAMFRNKNYEELCGFVETVIVGVKKIGYILIRFFLGETAIDILFNGKNSAD